MRLLTWSVAALGALGWTMVPISPVSAQIAVVVHRTSPVDSISMDDLRRLFLGRTTTFKNSQRVILLELPAVRKQFYKSALGMTEDQVKRHWVAILFAGETGTPPKEMVNAEELKKYIVDHPGAIGFLNLSAADATVRVVVINGHRPSDSDYPLR